MKTWIIVIALLFCGSITHAQETLNEVDFTNTPEKFTGKIFTAVFIFNPMDSTVDRGRTESSRHYGGLLVSKINGDNWSSTHVYFNKKDSEIIKKINSALKDQNFLEPMAFTLKVRYLGKFGDFGGGRHGFEMVEWVE